MREIVHASDFHPDVGAHEIQRRAYSLSGREDEIEQYPSSDSIYGDIESPTARASATRFPRMPSRFGPPANGYARNQTGKLTLIEREGR